MMTNEFFGFRTNKQIILDFVKIKIFVESFGPDLIPYLGLMEFEFDN